jgi:hypothetical protein
VVGVGLFEEALKKLNFRCRPDEIRFEFRLAYTTAVTNSNQTIGARAIGIAVNTTVALLAALRNIITAVNAVELLKRQRIII